MVHASSLTDDFETVIMNLQTKKDWLRIFYAYLFGELRERIAGKGVKIVFPEGNDDRVVRAAARLKFEGLVDPIILGDPAEVHKSWAILVLQT